MRAVVTGRTKKRREGAAPTRLLRPPAPPVRLTAGGTLLPRPRALTSEPGLVADDDAGRGHLFHLFDFNLEVILRALLDGECGILFFDHCLSPYQWVWDVLPGMAFCY